VVGVASFERRPADSPTAEFAVFVADDAHGRGIGTLVLEHLAGRARAVGVVELAGEVMSGNIDMIRVMQDLDRRVRSHVHAGLIHARFRPMPDAAALALADARDRAATAASLRPLLRPSGVAVVGAGRDPAGIGHATLRALLEAGYTGKL